MQLLAKHEECTGCSACASICPKSCIEMKEDISGFLYPVINANKCINCNRCQIVCPAINKKQTMSAPDDAYYYITQNKNNKVLSESSSGGAFTAFAETIIKKGGIVFGAEMSDDFSVRHTYCKTVQELKRYRGSKYVQSDMGDSYSNVKKFLDKGYWVLFSGTPCQIAGLSSFLEKPYDKLVLLDIVCFAIPSPAVWKKYVELYQQRLGKINRFNFRDKGYGYSYSTMAIYGTSKSGDIKVVRRGSESDEWLRIFLKGYCSRNSCYECKFQEGKREADITIWDCNDIYNIAHELDNNKGATNTIIWTNKGKALFSEAKEMLYYRELQYDYDILNSSRKALKYPEVDRTILYEDLRNLGAEKFFEKYAPDSISILLKEKIRNQLYILHIYDTVRKSIHFMRKISKNEKCIRKFKKK